MLDKDVVTPQKKMFKNLGLDGTVRTMEEEEHISYDLITQ